MIRSALQAILSKTLQSLLYKYVEILHVDDLQYPSVLGFVSGAVSSASANGGDRSERDNFDENKYGVHVKNVKLRNGTVIYKFSDFHEIETGGASDGGKLLTAASCVLQLGEGGHIGSLKVG